MYNILISAGVAIVAFFLVTLTAGFHYWWGGLLAALLLFMGSFLLIARIVSKKLNELMEPARRDLEAQRLDKGIRGLKEALRLAKWQIYVESQINSAIGSVLYAKREFKEAFPYLEKGFFKDWASMGMLGISYMKRNKPEKMKATFDKALLASPKESLLYALYAYCLNETGESVKACEVLAKGEAKLPGDENIKENLELLRAGKRMKMKGYGDVWYNFHLEPLAALQKQQQKQQLAAMGRRPRFVRK
jgi:tetratricopeptide (TPR) repeat protein